jgi:ribose transport system permease protein
MRLKSFWHNNSRELSVVVAIAIMFIVFGSLNSQYFRLTTIRDIINQATIYGLMGVGITGVIIIGGIDLSVGSVLALVGSVVAQAVVGGVSTPIAVLIGLVMAFVCGTINGLLVTRLHLQPFIATMGTMSIYRGLAYIITNGYPVLGLSSEFRRAIDRELTSLFRTSTLIFLAFGLLMYVVLRKTQFGNYVYAVGGNEEATRLSGIRVSWVKTMMFAVGMLGTGLAALVQIAKLGTGDPTTGQGYELEAIAASAIGGTSMAGGRGNVIGTILGAILFAGLKVGLIVLGVETFYQYVATGAVIIVAAYIEILQSRIAQK